MGDVRQRLQEGGPGSGNFGHSGRPGMVGGSASGGGADPHRRAHWSKAEGEKINAERDRNAIATLARLYRKVGVAKSEIKKIIVAAPRKVMLGAKPRRLAYEGRTMGEIRHRIHEGGPGSGNFGHAGRPGQVGGSTKFGSEERRAALKAKKEKETSEMPWKKVKKGVPPPGVKWGPNQRNRREPGWEGKPVKRVSRPARTLPNW